MSAPFRPRYGAWRPGLGVLTVCTLGVLLASAMAGRRYPLGRPTALEPRIDQAARAAEEAMEVAGRVLVASRQEESVATAPEAAPDPSGLIGGELTPLVTTLGNLDAKRLATRPAWARVLTAKLAARGIGRGSVVAAGFSGSFPGLDLAATLACQALGAEVLAVSSVTASNWGANQPGFTWPEIELRLVKKGIIRRASVAVSVGGDSDRGLDLEPEGRAEAERIMRAAAAGLGVPALEPPGYRAAILDRMNIYDGARRGRPVALYINVGGSDASLGRSAAILRLRSGFLPAVPFDRSEDRGVIARFVERGVPVLMLLNVRDLAARWGIE